MAELTRLDLPDPGRLLGDGDGDDDFAASDDLLAVLLDLGSATPLVVVPSALSSFKRSAGVVPWSSLLPSAASAYDFGSSPSAALSWGSAGSDAVAILPNVVRGCLIEKRKHGLNEDRRMGFTEVPQLFAHQ